MHRWSAPIAYSLVSECIVVGASGWASPEGCTARAALRSSVDKRNGFPPPSHERELLQLTSYTPLAFVRGPQASKHNDGLHRRPKTTTGDPKLLCSTMPELLKASILQ